MALDAVIFDLDGTLVDTNDAHAHAWKTTLEEFGYNVGEDRIAREIGKGGDKLVPFLLGEEAEEEHGEALRERHGERYREIISGQEIPVFEKARALIRAIKEKGLRTAVATASKQENLEKTLARAGFTDLLDLVDAIVTDTDVDRSKPEPDVVRAAVRKLDLSPAQCAMIGDTPYDIEACCRAGVVGIGVLTGVWTREEMMQAGTRAVYHDTADALENLDEMLKLASPGKAHLTCDLMESLMREALAEAEKGFSAGEAPIGSILARSDGTLAGRAHNRENERNTRIAHAEIEAFYDAAARLDPDEKNLILVSTLEPCVMCHGAAMEAGVETILYGLKAPSDGGPARSEPVRSPGAVMPRVVGGILAQESRALFARWLEQHPEATYVRDLLEKV